MYRSPLDLHDGKVVYFFLYHIIWVPFVCSGVYSQLWEAEAAVLVRPYFLYSARAGGHSSEQLGQAESSCWTLIKAGDDRRTINQLVCGEKTHRERDGVETAGLASFVINRDFPRHLTDPSLPVTLGSDIGERGRPARPRAWTNPAHVHSRWE